MCPDGALPIKNDDETTEEERWKGHLADHSIFMATSPLNNLPGQSRSRSCANSSQVVPTATTPSPFNPFNGAKDLSSSNTSYYDEPRIKNYQ